MPDSQLRQDFIEGMSRAAASVSVVTTDGPAGRHGITVSAMTSVSADGEAPTMLVCLNAAASVLPPLLENGCFCINVLGSDQQAVADIFAGRVDAPGGDRFAAGRFTPGPTGAPVLQGALVAFDCELVSAEKIDTHHVCIGAVRGVDVAPEGAPLLYGMRSYLRAAKP
ncbi:flavin reductase [Rhodobacteraceae bacterium W635]|uniref:flavin reductase family protein n=1 Tax=Nioella halotolerans TaxID=2303578 RepID=UPI000E3CB77A|nr:flavin reductase [Rhodobacteraceae bacterium W635]